MSSELLNPRLLDDFREDIPPVQCILWKGGTQYQRITFEEVVYPFDTLDHIKRLICHHMKGDARYISKFLFVGVPSGDEAYSEEDPSEDAMYIPLDYLWYPIGSNQARDMYMLRYPVKTLSEPDMRFIGSDGNYASPNYESRGRTTIEHAFLKPRKGRIPVFHVFPFHLLYEAYKGNKPISEMEWNRKFAPYFPDMTSDGPFVPKTKDVEEGLQTKRFIQNREHTLYQVNTILQTGYLPDVKMSGILHVSLLWKKPVAGFQGAAALFYPLRVTKERPYIRLLPSDGVGITKLHVEGILPIPTLHDPRIIDQWNKELSPTPKMDFCCIKYVHRPSMLSTPPLYGTIHVMNDGTMKLVLQPPKTISKLDPDLDFRDMEQIWERVFDGLPQQINAFQIHDLSAIFTIKTSLSKPKFTKKRLLARLPTFQSFFREIKALPDQSPILSIRYKAVSQYVSENEVFAFITLWSTKQELQDGDFIPDTLIEELQNEFQYSKKEATDLFKEWYKRKGEFVVEVPEEGDIQEGYRPGVDIHIYSQHPTYVIHVHHMDSEDTYRRLYRLVSILFVEEDGYFERGREVDRMERAIEMDQQEDKWDKERRQRDGKIENEVGSFDAEEKEPIQASLQENEYDWGIMNDPTLELGSASASASSSSASSSTPLPAPAAAAAAIPKRVARIKDVDRRVQPNQWIIRKLQELDKNLFGYVTGVKGDNGYSSKCQAVDDRQPVIITKEQYDDMREEYAEDDDLFWLIYPLEGDEDPTPPVGSEKVAVMKYGSDIHHIHYLFCPRFYCLLDDIMVREKDFISDRDREGNPKPRHTCPFCYGGLLTSEDRKKSLVEGRTVVERKKKAGKVHDHIGIGKQSDSTHPDGLSLPCCFIKQTALRIEDSRFEHIRSQIQEMDVVEQLVQQGDRDEEEEPIEYYETKLIDFNRMFESLNAKTYILESNKFPSAELFATPAKRFDEYFHQDSTRQLVSRVAIHLRLRPAGYGFLRVGIDNTINESLLGVIAPLLNCTSIIEVKERIEQIIQPRIFLNAHFGNLVLEFFDPANMAFMPETDQEIMKWSETNLGITMTSSNSYALLRIFNAYQRFIFFIKDPRQKKELRHIQPLLAEPGLFTVNGLQLIVLEDKGEEEHVGVRCPIFGVSMERHKNNDVAFVSRLMRTIGATEKEYAHYELYIYTTNKAGRGGQQEAHHVVKAWKQSEYESWPEIVQQRVKEYRLQCQSTYHSIYTPQRNIIQDTIIPLSAIVNGGAVRPNGIVKDYYNHLVAVTFRSKIGSSGMVIVPVVDDGVISISSSFSIKKIYLDWEDIRLAPVEEVIRYYKRILEPQFGLYEGYRVKSLVMGAEMNRMMAIQLENGIYVPVGEPKNRGELEEYGLPTVVIEELESELNKQMSGTARRRFEEGQDWSEWIRSSDVESGCGKDDGMENRLSSRDLEELYQQFRVMVSRWLSSQRVDSGLRNKIEDVLFRSDLPDYEKRKRLDILLSSMFLSWFYPDENWEMPTLSLLRKDCRVISTEDGCTGSCRWKEAESGGKCLLHVPKKTVLSETGNRSVETSDLFIKRIVDELVRFPVRRKQLMTRSGISLVTKMTNPIRDEDQYIVPESSVTWLDLLRFDWMKSKPEEPKYYEEMSREFTEEDQKGVEHMPDPWVNSFGEDTSLVIKWSDSTETPLVPLMPFMGMSIQDWGIEPTSHVITRDDLTTFARKTKRSVGILRWDGDDEKYVEEEEKERGRGWSATFIKRKTEQENVTLFITIGDKWGLLMEGDQTYLPVELLPEEIQRQWRETKITFFIAKKLATPAAPIITHTTTAPATQRILANVRNKEAPLIKKTGFTIRRRPIADPSEPVVPVVPAAPSEPAVAPAPSKKVGFPIRRRPIAAPDAPSEPAVPAVVPVPSKKVGFPIRRRPIAAPDAPSEPAVPAVVPVPSKKVGFPIRRRPIAAPDIPVAPPPPALARGPLEDKNPKQQAERPPPPPIEMDQPIKRVIRIKRPQVEYNSPIPESSSSSATPMGPVLPQPFPSRRPLVTIKKPLVEKPSV